MQSLESFVSWAARASLDELGAQGGGKVHPRLARDLAVTLALPRGSLQASMRAMDAVARPILPTGAEWTVLGLARLLGIAKDIVSNSTAPQANTFNVGRWLGEWVRRPQPALGGQRPIDVLGTSTGVAAVVRVLGAIESGSYQ